MSNQSKKRIGVVYSTQSDYVYNHGEKNEQVTPLPAFQILRVGLERKGRAGKEVTLVHGFKGTAEDRKNLSDLLKKKCGVGGTIEEETLVLQGDKRDFVVKTLLGLGFTQTKKSGS
jgi:translation initiation factor 1